MSVTMNELIQVLIRYIMGEEKKTHEEVTNMLLREALIARGLLLGEKE